MELELYYKDLNNIPELEWEADDLIGRSNFVEILRGAFPAFDENMEVCAFRLSPGKNRFITPNRAFLFTGTEGNGKRTLDNVFAMEMFDKCIDMKEGDEETPFRYYSIPVYRLKAKTKYETAQKIEELFEDLRKLCSKEEYEGIMLYISLGDLSGLLKHKKFSEIITEQVERLLNNKNAIIIVTGFCHCSVQILPKCIHNIFNVMELENPNEAQRMVYFNTIQEYNPSIKWDMSLQDIAKKTNNFTFRMMKRASENIYMWASGSIYKNGEDAGEYILGHKEQPFLVPSDIISFIIDNIGKGLYTENPALVPVQYSSIAQYPVVPESNTRFSDEKIKDEPEEDKQKPFKATKINSRSERKALFNTVMPPLMMKAQNIQNIELPVLEN